MGHIASIGKDVEVIRDDPKLSQFFGRQEWRTFAMQHLSEIVQKEATVLGKRDPNAPLEDSMSDNFEDALNSADFVVVNQPMFECGDTGAVDDDPWRQFNDFSPEEVVIENIPGMDSDDVETEILGRESIFYPKVQETDEFEMDDPFDAKVEETEFKIEYVAGDPLGEKPTITEESDKKAEEKVNSVESIKEINAKEEPQVTKILSETVSNKIKKLEEDVRQLVNAEVNTPKEDFSQIDALQNTTEISKQDLEQSDTTKEESHPIDPEEYCTPDLSATDQKP